MKKLIPAYVLIATLVLAGCGSIEPPSVSENDTHAVKPFIKATTQASAVKPDQTDLPYSTTPKSYDEFYEAIGTLNTIYNKTVEELVDLYRQDVGEDAYDVFDIALDDLFDLYGIEVKGLFEFIVEYNEQRYSDDKINVVEYLEFYYEIMQLYLNSYLDAANLYVEVYSEELQAYSEPLAGLFGLKQTTATFSSISGMDWKEFIQFFNEKTDDYIKTAYKLIYNPFDKTVLSEYIEFTGQIFKWSKQMDTIQIGLTGEDLLTYLLVKTDIMQKLSQLK